MDLNNAQELQNENKRNGNFINFRALLCFMCQTVWMKESVSLIMPVPYISELCGADV